MRTFILNLKNEIRCFSGFEFKISYPQHLKFEFKSSRSAYVRFEFKKDACYLGGVLNSKQRLIFKFKTCIHE